MQNYWLERKRMRKLDLMDEINSWYSCFATDTALSDYFQVTSDQIQNYELSDLISRQDFFNSCLENIESWTESYIYIDHI